MADKSFFFVLTAPCTYFTVQKKFFLGQRNMEKFTLTNENIAEIGNKTEKFLSEANCTQDNRLRLQLAAESVLLQYQDTFGTDKELTVKFVKRFGNYSIEYSLKGERCDPFESDEELNSDILRSILSYMEILPAYRYRNGTNTVVFNVVKKQRSQFFFLCTAILAAVVSGLLCLLLPDPYVLFIKNSLVGPLFGSFMGLLSAIATPLIFLSVTWGIYSIGDTATLGKIGKRMISRFIACTFILCGAVCLCVLPLFDISDSASGSFAFSELYNMILGIVPSNFVKPFVDGNPIQVIFLAVMFGLSMLVLGSKTNQIAALVDQANLIVMLIMKAVTALIPFFVFCSIFTLILNNNFSLLVKTYKLFLLFILGSFFIMGAYLCLVGIRKKISPFLLAEKLMPTFMITITTASSAAAYSANTDTCINKLGINPKAVHLGLPLGQTLFMPGAAVEFLISSLCMAEIFGTPISLSWVVMALITSCILAIAAPPVPGGSITCYTILFTQLGLPAEAVAIIITLNVIFDFLATSANVLCLQTELIELAGDIDMLDYEVLHKANIR